MKYIVNGKEYTTTNNPHGALREILINAMLEEDKEVKIVKE